jgi:hypothetical protein
MGPDEYSAKIWNDVNNLLGEYGEKLDVIYEDVADTGAKITYKKLIFWNGTTITF